MITRLPKAEFEALVFLNDCYGRGEIDRVPTCDLFAGLGTGEVALRLTSGTETARFRVEYDGSRATIFYKRHQKTISIKL